MLLDDIPRQSTIPNFFHKPFFQHLFNRIHRMCCSNPRCFFNLPTSYLFLFFKVLFDIFHFLNPCLFSDKIIHIFIDKFCLLIFIKILVVEVLKIYTKSLFNLFSYFMQWMQGAHWFLKDHRNIFSSHFP